MLSLHNILNLSSVMKVKNLAERFNRTPLKEFYQIAMIKKFYSSINELQDDLDQFIYDFILKEQIKGQVKR